MKLKTLGFIGGGRITKIFLQGLENKSVSFDLITVFEPNTEISIALKKQFPAINIADSVKIPAQQDLVVLAVHPPVVMETLNKIKETVEETALVISLAPKITIEKMNSVIPKGKFIRMIPNATSYINKGYNPVAFHDSLNQEEKESFLKLVGVLGKTMEVDEGKLEGYAIVSAMLPTYFWFQWKKMEDIAFQTGFTEEEAKKIIGSTLQRSLKLFYKSGLPHDEVMDLIPVKPLGENETEINSILESKLLRLYEKIKP